MSGRIDHARLDRLLHEVLATEANTSARRMAASRVVEYLYRSGMIPAWARASGHRTSFFDHVLTVHEREQVMALQLQRRLVETSSFGQVASWLGWLYWKSRQAVRDAAQTSAYTIASGMSAVLRRYARVQAATETMTSVLGRAPTAQEVVAWVNAGRDPAAAKRSGTYVTVAELAAPVLVSYSLDVDAATAAATGVPSVQCDPALVTQVQPGDEAEQRERVTVLGARLLELVQAELAPRFPAGYTDAVVVGRQWVVAAAGYGVAPTVAGLQAEFGWGQARAGRALRAWAGALRDLAARGALEVLRDGTV